MSPQYVGGQLTIKNSSYVRCGQIKTVSVEGSGEKAIVCVELAWLAEFKNGDGEATKKFTGGKWVAINPESYRISKKVFSFTTTGQHLTFSSSELSETAIFVLPAKNGLDPRDVQGLNWPTGEE